MYDQYRDWMSDNGYRSLGAAKFYRRVEEIFPFTQKKKTRIDSVAVNGFPCLAESIIADIFD